ncbi:MAG TPA: hypothetical protein VN965_04945, partial [Candidatus Dormibacteraeota bacterium]|nr:hypothetical protein [Candidatus Dormibacteraeota bacterium]
MGSRFSALTILSLAVLLAACAQATGSSSASPSPPATGCRSGPPEAGVHNPDRLQVLDPCKHAEGIVVDVAHEDDGDYHVWFRADPGYEYLLNPDNHFQARPAMLAEITPDCPASANPPDAQSAARCPKSTLPVPKLGDHIAIDGPWVL